jgi:hypothetical protein
MRCTSAQSFSVSDPITALTLEGPRLRGAANGEAAGLVSSKTSLEHFVSLAPTACAERRVKRLKRAVWASGHLHGMAANGFRPDTAWFVTPTYVGVDDWKADQISAALHAYRQWCTSHGYSCRYTWVGELQQRGAVHYHLLVWLPRGVIMPKWDLPHKMASGKVRAAFWPHGMTNTQIAKAGVGYLMKYLSKLGELTRFPKGMRLYGVGGLCKTGRAVRAWYNLPEWAKRSFGVGELTRKGPLLIVRATGEILEPAFKVKLTPSGLLVIPLRELPERFHDGAYSTWPAS